MPFIIKKELILDIRSFLPIDIIQISVYYIQITLRKNKGDSEKIITPKKSKIYKNKKKVKKFILNKEKNGILLLVDSLKLKKKQNINILIKYEFEEKFEIEEKFQTKKNYFFNFKFLEKIEKNKFLSKYEKNFFFENRFQNFNEYLPINLYGDFFCQLNTFVFSLNKEIIFKDKNFNKDNKKKNLKDLQNNYNFDLKKDYKEFILSYNIENKKYDLLEEIIKIQNNSLKNIINFLNEEKQEEEKAENFRKIEILTKNEILLKIEKIKKNNKILENENSKIEDYIINLEDYIITELTQNYIKKKKKFFEKIISQKNTSFSKITPNFQKTQIQKKNNFEFTKFTSEKIQRKINLLKGISEQKFQSSKKQKKYFKSEKGIHLIIFIHGYKGTPFDLDFLKNHIYIINPFIKLYSIKSIKNDTKKDLDFLSKKIGEEIENFIKEKHFLINKLSFIGFSLGGILCRSCLKYLKKFEKRFFFLLTLSSPHLGLNFNPKSLFNFGLKILKFFQNTKSSLKQLLMEDSDFIENSFLFKLSKIQNVKFFKYIIFIGSEEDQFSPLQSSLFSTNSTFNKNKFFEVYKKMIDNLFFNINPDCFVRLNLKFGGFFEKDFGSYIGKKQHIEVVSNDDFLEFIVFHYDFLFVS